jgi:hypothetical protein
MWNGVGCAQYMELIVLPFLDGRHVRGQKSCKEVYSAASQIHLLNRRTPHLAFTFLS